MKYKCVNCVWAGEEKELTVKNKTGVMWSGKCPVCGDEVVGDKPIEAPKEDLDFDINNDGKVDKIDISLIAKKLGSRKKNSKRR